MAGLIICCSGGGPAASNLIEGGAFWWADRVEAQPDLQFFMVVGAGIEEGVEAVPGGNGCTINLGQIRPARAARWLNSADPADAPRVIPNYFGDPHDLEAITDGTIFAMEVMEQPAIRRYIAARQLPEVGPLTRDRVRRFCQTTAHAALHPAGTCRAGTDDGVLVVDPQLRLHGIEGLRW